MDERDHKAMNEELNQPLLQTDVSGSTSKYRWWDVLEDLPEGWVIDKYAGSPAPNTIFITNGKSVLNGQKRALLKVKGNYSEKPNSYKEKATVKENLTVEDDYKFPAKTVNDLARLKFKEQLLKEIMFDLMVCEIENWDKKEYINELKKMLNGIDTSNKKKATTQNLPDLFSSVGF